jgi:succinyl-diaminopimelate desuccinylase
MAAFEHRSDLIETAKKMLAIKAISPESGGTGESKRADYLEAVLRRWGLKPERYDYVDNHGATRSSLVVKYGKKQRTLWLLVHIDTVSEGDIGEWKTDPFKAVVKDGKIYCRGAQDNGQSVLSGMYALKSLMGKDLKYNYGLVLAADEEVGSRYGVQKLLKERIFNKGDMFIVPDIASPGGKDIEIAEKSMLWLKATVIGKQVHGSTPDEGLNAFKEAAKFALEVDEYLHKRYAKKNSLFSPSGSTFEMTKHEKNVDSINIIPGKEVLYFDFRVLPEYKLSSVLADVNRIARKYKAKISIEVHGSTESCPTPANAEIVKLLQGSIKRTLNTNPRLVGIGGGTFGAYLRNAGFDAAVWGTGDEVAHQSNEYARISDIENEIAVFSDIFLSGTSQKARR